MDSIKKIAATVVLVLLVSTSFAQITQGKIVYERRTNLKKTLKDNQRASQFINKSNKIRKESFELAFNDSTSVFSYIEEEDEPEGMMKYLTLRNKVYQDLAQKEFLVEITAWGDPMYLMDSIGDKVWQVTDHKRNFAGYTCYKSIWQMNDSTRIYAWFSPDIVPSVGPEGYSGLPGAILGLATEDGSVVYFAKEITVVEVSSEETDYSKLSKDAHTKHDLTEILLTNMGKWIKRKDLDAMFAWY